MSGPSGAGKSRLALELCLAAHPVWRAGFVDKEQLTDLRFWRQWRPNRPTLLVLDDAGTRGETSGNLARCLGAKQYRPRFQIRLLLIEREASASPGAVSLRDGGWFESFLGAGTIERNAVFGARYPGRDGPDLAVGPLRDADLGQILAAAVPADTSEDHRDAVLKRLPSFDPERRALFAIILADSSTGVKDRIEAVREILENDRQSRWQPAGYTEDDAALLAISTILDGVARDRLRGHAEWLDRAVAQFKASRFRRLTGQDEASRLGYLKPNIVGELFVLDQLQARSEEEARRLVDAAWAIDAVAAAGFMIRTVFDYPEQLELRRLIGAPAGPEDAARHWASAIVDITRNMPPRHVALGEWLLAEGGRAALVRPNDAEIFDLLARLTFNIWQLYGRADRPDAAKACRGKLDALVAKHPDRTRARKLEARMLMSDLMSDLVAIAVADEQAMARPLGPAPYTFQPSITRFAEAQRIFDRMVASLPRGKPDDELADLFAAGAFHLVLGYARPAITIRRFWMPAALILEGDVEIQLAKAQAIYPKLRRVAKPTPPGSDARHWLAQAAAVLSAAYVERKQIEAVAKLRDEIEAMSSSPEDARVREELSRIGFNLVLGLSREGNATAVAEAMAWLDKFADTHPEQAFIQERRQRARKALEA